MNKKLGRNLIIAAVVVGLVIGGIFIKVKFFTKPKTPSVITALVSKGDIEKTVLATGALEPYKLVSVGAQTSGRVVKLAVNLGDYVNQGDLIAEIDSASQKNTLATAEAKINSVNAQIEQTNSSLLQAQLNYERQKRLYAQDAASKADLESAEANYKSQIGSLKSLKAQLTEANISRNDAKLNLGYTRITAPISGNVLAIVTKEGQTINSMQTAPTIVKLGQTDRMTVKAEISEADVVNVKPGMEIYFTTLGNPNKRYKAILRSIAPAPVTIETTDRLTPSTNTNAIYYMAIFDVDNSDGSLRTFMTAQVSIVLQNAKGVVMIQASALGNKNPNGTYQVRVLGKDNKIEARNVKIGLNDGTNAQVLDGVKVGEKVVIADAANAPKETTVGGPPPG